MPATESREEGGGGNAFHVNYFSGVHLSGGRQVRIRLAHHLGNMCMRCQGVGYLTTTKA